MNRIQSPRAAVFFLLSLPPVMAGQDYSSYTQRPPQVSPVFECIERPSNLDGTPLAAFVPGDPWGYFSTESTFTTTQTIPAGNLFGNFFAPLPQSYNNMPTTFTPG